MASPSIEHIHLDEQGVARVAGTRTKVIQIVMDKRAHGWGPEEIHAQHPHLSLADVHAALAYYYDHQTQLDSEIERDHNLAIDAQASAGEPEAARKLRRLGKLP